MENGDLLQAAEAAGFDVLVTADRNIRYQQNPEGRKTALVVLTQMRWGLVRRMLIEIAAAVVASTDGAFVEVDIPFYAPPS